MKALVISGGGSKGAFAGGVAEFLIGTQGKKYDLFVGSSVGSILISQLAIGNISKLKKTFTSVRNRDVYNIFPFSVIKKNGKITTKINHFNTVRAFIKGAKTFGESKNLKILIKKSHSNADFEKLKTAPDVVFTVSNLTKQKVAYFHAKECNYEDYCDWMWASANYVPFMSLMTKNNCQYADGGFGSFVPVRYAIEQGATEIDVIILDTELFNEDVAMLTNPFASLIGVFRFMSNQIGLKDLIIAKLKGKQEKVDVNLWYAPEDLTDNPLYFNKKQMTKWWQQGYDYAKQTKPKCHCFLPDGKIIEL
jgi:predicted patatin/cPLA2 family phospholipase